MTLRKSEDTGIWNR